MRKHIVMYRFDVNKTPPHLIDEIFDLLKEAKKQIPGMQSFSYGTNAGTALSRGFSHCFVMDFLDVNALKTYLDHKNHLSVRVKVRQLVKSEEDIFEFDYDYSG